MTYNISPRLPSHLIDIRPMTVKEYSCSTQWPDFQVMSIARWIKETVEIKGNFDGFLGRKMLPLEKTCTYDPLPNLVFRMPRVVVDQKAKFESDELFRKLSRESEVRYTGHRERPIEERRLKFKAGCREGYTEIAFVTTGTNLQLFFGACTNGCRNLCEFDTDKNKVHIRSSFIMNGVCVRWRGTLDLERLDGVGCLEFDEELAQIEDTRLQQQLELYNKRLRDFEDKQRAFRPPRIHRTREEISTLDDVSSGSASN